MNWDKNDRHPIEDIKAAIAVIRKDTGQITPERAFIQPNPGWGVLCETCSNRHHAEKLDCDFPCKKVIFYGVVPHPVYGHALLPNLIRWIDESETCPDYQKQCNQLSRVECLVWSQDVGSSNLLSQTM